MAFTRSELELLTIPQLGILCRRYGIQPIGKGGQKQSYISALLSFSSIAVQQVEQAKGLTAPTFSQFQELGRILDQMGELTREQQALLRLTLEGYRMEYPARYMQERLLAIYKAKNLLSELIEILMI